MPEKLFRINIYDVEATNAGDGQVASIEDAMVKAGGQPLADREKNVNGKSRRLDAMRQQDGIILLNFVSFEYSGPGRVRRGQPTQAIALGPDESFAPETAMIYDPGRSLAFVESSVGSMGPGAIVGYIEEFADSGNTYSMIPRADLNAAARARRHQVFRNLKMRITLGPITDLDRQAGIDPVKAFGENYGAGSIDIEIKSERPRDRSLARGTVLDLLSRFTGGNRNIPQITQLQVTGREYDDDPLEVIDLIQHREKRHISLAIDAATRKIPHQTRWDALVHAHRTFV